MTRRAVKVGSVTIGGGAPIVVQSMTNTDTRDVAATVAQIERLQAAGCEIVRVAVPDRAAAAALSEIKERIPLPLVADIHFDHRLALAAIEAGVDKLRLNPGNITDPEKIGEVVEAAKEAGIPIRVGANSGSLAPEFRGPHGGATAEGMVESALREIRILEERGFHDIVISLKATDVPTTIAAYRMIASKVDYPLHIGITEAGTPWEGSIRSAVGLGVLLEEGLGDTIRVSLTGTCGRAEIDLFRIAEEVQEGLKDVTAPLTVAMLGCVVNGIGEAGEADVGLVGGAGAGTIYVRGRITQRNVPEGELPTAVVAAVRKLAEEVGNG